MQMFYNIQFTTWFHKFPIQNFNLDIFFLTNQVILITKKLQINKQDSWCFTVEKILNGSLDSIPSPSPSLKIQILAAKFTWGAKAKHWCPQTFGFQKFVDNAQQCFAFTHQANSPAHNFNVHWRWRWWDQIQVTF